MKRMLFLIFLAWLMAYAPSQGEAESFNSKAGQLQNTLQVVRGRGKLIAGVTSQEPPLGFLDDNGVLKGLEIDIGQALARKIFHKPDCVEFTPVPIEEWVDFLKSGKIDILLAPVFIKEGQREEIDYSIPCFISGGLVVVKKDSKIRSYEDLAGKSVATIRGSRGGTIVREFLPQSKPVEFENNADALRALNEHKVDAFAQLDVFIFYLEEKERDLRVVDLRPVYPSPIQLGIRKGDKEWRDFVNVELLEMMTTGEYHKILEKWFGRVRGEILEKALKNEIRKEG